MSANLSHGRADYEAPKMTILGTVQDLTAQKSGSEADGFKSDLPPGEFQFPSGFRP